MPKENIIVIPCFNEVRRLSDSFLESLLARPGTRLLLVDDGSTDGTGARLKAWAARHPDQADVLVFDHNVGKGEAVRQGLLRAFTRNPSIAGYVDSDAATPAAECLRLLNTLEESPEPVIAVFGSRVKLLGSDIRRKFFRHYAGRIFATLASRILALPVYDTQCGAKFFKNTEMVRRAFESPFHSRWVFDVELIGRLAEEALLEVPLRMWQDMQDSKRTPWDYARVGWDLARIWTSLMRTRSRKGPR